MRISPISNIRNNQKQNNVSPNFNGARFNKSLKEIDRMSSEGMAEFAKTIHKIVDKFSDGNGIEWACNANRTNILAPFFAVAELCGVKTSAVHRATRVKDAVYRVKQYIKELEKSSSISDKQALKHLDEIGDSGFYDDHHVGDGALGTEGC